MKKLITLLLVLAMLCLGFAGCSSTEPKNSTEAEQSTQLTEEVPESTNAPEDAEDTSIPEENAEADLNAGNEYALPISDELTTFMAWMSFSSDNGMESPNDSYAFQELEKISNVHMEWTLAPTASTVEVFNLSVASGEYPDMYITAGNNADYYVGGLDKFIDDEVIIDLKELIPEYAPNYNYWRTRDPMVEKMTTTDGGNVPYFQTISRVRQDSYMGGIIRQDLLDAAGSGIVASDIKTYDDLHEALLVLKDYAGNQPLLLGTTNGMATFYMVGYGTTDDFYNDNGTATFGPAQESFKKYLHTIHQWYEEGLVDRDFVSNSDFFSMMNMTMSGDYVVSVDMAINLDTYELAVPGQQWEAFSPPMENTDDIRHLNYNDISAYTLGGGTITITTACEEPETLCRWIDLGYSEDISMIYDWGIEGLSYIIDANGDPEWTELVYKNEDMNFRNSRGWYTVGSTVAHLYDFNYDYTPETSEKVRNAGKVWDINYEDTMTMPTLSMEERDAAEFTSLMGDINTTVEEYTCRFILGDYDIDATWDTYIAALETVGLARATELEQAALTSFLNR